VGKGCKQMIPLRYVTAFALSANLAFIGEANATTRAQVIATGPAYTGHSWACNQRNLLDTDDDGVDDRPSWPFAAGGGYTGEAYAWGYWDKPSDFGANINTEAASWIAGKRDVDTLPFGYAGFTGLDCSGFASRVLGLSAHNSTEELQALSILVSTSNLKAGDLLFVPGHVVVFADAALAGNSVSIMHAVTWSYGVSQQVRRAISESTEFRIEDGLLYLRSKSRPGDTWEDEKVQHDLYSLFPQFQDITPEKDAVISSARAEIKYNIKSGTNIDASSIILKIDNVAKMLPTYSDAKEIQVSYTPTEDLADGQHTLYLYAKNAINLEDDVSVEFTVRASSFAVYDEAGNAIADNAFVAVDGILTTGAGGTAKITLDGPVQQEVIFSSGEAITAQFDGMWDGVYIVSAYDADNNLLSSSTFTNDRTEPWFYTIDENGEYGLFATNSTTITVHAEDDVSKVDRIVMDGPSGSTRTVSGQTPVDETFSGLSAGEYTVWVYDRSGNAANQIFWVIAPPPGSGHEPLPELESTTPISIPFKDGMPFSPAAVLAVSLPDGGQYLGIRSSFDSSLLLKIDNSGSVAWSTWIDEAGGNTLIRDLAVDGEGNTYMVADDFRDSGDFEWPLYKISAQGYGSGKVNLPNVRIGEVRVAVDPVRNRVYAAYIIDYGIQVASFDTNLNPLDIWTYPMVLGSADLSGISVDKAGDVWVGGAERTSDSLLVFHFGPNLSNSSVMRAGTVLSESERGGELGFTGNPNGGVLLPNNGVIWRVTSVGFGAPIMMLSHSGLIEADVDGNLYEAAENIGNGVVKRGPDNAFAWDPPYLDTGRPPAAITVPQIGKLDVVFNVNGLSISRYASPAPVFTATAPDGLATLNSATGDAAVSALSPEIQASAGAAAEGDGLLAVTPFYEVTSGSSTLSLPADITLTYSTGTLSEMELSPWDISVYEYDAENGWVYMDDQVMDEDNNRLSAPISGSARIFAIFGSLPDESAPVAQLVVNGLPLEDGATAYINANDPITISAEDFGTGDISGVADILYSTDVDFSWETAAIYSGPFTLSTGAHTVYYTANDYAGNQAEVKTAFITVNATGAYQAVDPSSGPIGMPFTITGTGFGAYSAGTTIVLIGGATAPLTLWSTDTIKGTVPGSLAAGEYPVLVMRGTTTIANVQPFTVATPVQASIMPSSDLPPENRTS